LRKEILQKAKAEAQQILTGVNKQIENTIRAIKESNAEKEKTKLARQELSELIDQINIEGAAEDDVIARKMEQLRRREERKKKKGSENKNETGEKKEIQPDLLKIEIGDKVKLFGQDTVGEVLDVNGKSIMAALAIWLQHFTKTGLRKSRTANLKNFKNIRPAIRDKFV